MENFKSNELIDFQQMDKQDLDMYDNNKVWRFLAENIVLRKQKILSKNQLYLKKLFNKHLS